MRKVVSSELQPMELGPISVRDYLRMPETNLPEELRYGWLVREPPPSTGHQAVMTAITVAVATFVIDRGLGLVVENAAVVLDEALKLAVEPDLLVVLKDRRHLLREGRVWGAPNLTVETLSPSNTRHDRLRKLAWYQSYGVQEYWIVDPKTARVEVIDFEAEAAPAVRVYGEADVLESRVLPGFSHPVAKFFEHAFDYVMDRPILMTSDANAPSTHDANAEASDRYDTDPT